MDAAELVLQLEQAHPLAARLARWSCLPVRVSPAFLRLARLRMLSQAGTGDEADLWLSDLVESRSGAGFAFRRGVREQLRESLRLDAPALDLVWHTVHLEHAPWLTPRARLEEELTWRLLRDAADPSIEALWADVVRELDTGPNPEGVARWVIRAVDDLPAGTLEHVNGRRAYRGAHLVLGDASVLGTNPQQFLETGEFAFATRKLPRRRIHVGLTQNNLLVSPLAPIEHGHEIEVPATRPLWLQVEQYEAYGREPPRVFTLSDDTAQAFDVWDGDLRSGMQLRLIDGSRLGLTLSAVHASLGRAQVLLSAVRAEFSSYCDALRHDLTRPNVSVAVQEDFIVTGTETLAKLDDYIRQCDAVIHLVGDMTGALAQAPSLALIRSRYPDLGERLPPLAPLLQPGAPALSYTQWEAWLALYHGKPLFIAMPEEGTPRDARYALVPEQRTAQQAHLRRLAEVDRYPEIRFSSSERLAVEVLRSNLHEVLARAGPARKPIHLPYPSIGKLFKGRDAMLDALRARLVNASATGTSAIVGRALCGPGGAGKTRLAVEYAWRHAEDYTSLLFVGADSPEALQRNLAALCAPALLDLPEHQVTEGAAQVAAVLAWLQRHPGWLLIADNVDTETAAGAVEELLPQLPGGHVLITSRLTDWSGGVEAVPLAMLAESPAVELLLARTDARRRKQADDEAQARTLAGELGGLALALEQAGSYIAERRLSIADYLAQWRGHRDKGLARYDPSLMQYPESVAVTMQICFDDLGEPARRLLQRLAWLAAEPVPESLLDVAVPGAVVEDDAFAALAELESYSMVTRADAVPSFKIDRLIQVVARSGENTPALTEALGWIDDAFVGDPLDVRTWRTLDHLLPHARAVAEHADAAGIAAPTAARLMSRCGLLLLAKALHGEAEPLTRRALAIDEQSFGTEHPNVAGDLNNLAQLLRATNRLAEAEPLIRRALDIDEKSFGAERPEVATDLNNLAQLLQETNRLAEAEPLIRRALDINERNFGAEHPKVARDLNNLAQLLQATNRLAEAEPLMRRALAIDEQSFGAEHAEVARDLNKLAQFHSRGSRDGQGTTLVAPAPAEVSQSASLADFRRDGRLRQPIEAGADDHQFLRSELAPYLEASTRRLQYAKPLGSKLPTSAEEVYVPLGVALERPSDADGQTSDILALLASSPHLLLEGPLGSGKTTLLRILALQQASAPTGRIPIYLQLREIHGPGATLSEQIVREFSTSGLEDSSALWTRLLGHEGTLFLLDGLDEVRIEKRDELVHQISELTSKAQRSAFIVAARPGTLQFDLKGFARARVLPLTSAGVAQFVRHWFHETPEAAERLLAAIVGRPDLRDLAQTPLLLSQLCALSEPRGQLPARRSELLRLLVEIQVETWDASKFVSRGRVPAYLRVQLLQELALQMLLQGRQDFDVSVIEEVAAKSVRSGDRAGSQVSNVAQTLANDTPLLTQQRSHVYSFTHLAVQEYLAACELVARQSPDWLRERLFEDRWVPVIEIAAEISSDSSEILEEVMSSIAGRIGRSSLASTTVQKAISGQLQVFKGLLPLVNFLQTALANPSLASDRGSARDYGPIDQINSRLTLLSDCMGRSFHLGADQTEWEVKRHPLSIRSRAG